MKAPLPPEGGRVLFWGCYRGVRYSCVPALALPLSVALSSLQPEKAVRLSAAPQAANGAHAAPAHATHAPHAQQQHDISVVSASAVSDHCCVYFLHRWFTLC